MCGSPSEEYWKKSKLPHATIFKPQQSYKRCIRETFKDFPPSSMPLIDALLAIDPSDRQTATDALRSEVSLFSSCAMLLYLKLLLDVSLKLEYSLCIIKWSYRFAHPIILSLFFLFTKPGNYFVSA